MTSMYSKRNGGSKNPALMGGPGDHNGPQIRDTNVSTSEQPTDQQAKKQLRIQDGQHDDLQNVNSHGSKSHHVVEFDEPTDILIEIPAADLQELWNSAVKVNSSTDALGANADSSVQNLELHICLVADDGTRLTEDVVLDYMNWRKSRKTQTAFAVSLGVGSEAPSRVWFYASVMSVHAIILACAFPLFVGNSVGSNNAKTWNPQDKESNVFLQSLSTHSVAIELNNGMVAHETEQFSLVSQIHEDTNGETGICSWHCSFCLVGTFGDGFSQQDSDETSRTKLTSQDKKLHVGLNLLRKRYCSSATNSCVYVTVSDLIPEMTANMDTHARDRKHLINTFSVFGVISRGDGSLATSPFLLGTAIKSNFGHWNGDWIPSVPMELPDDAFTEAGSDYHLLLYVVIPPHTASLRDSRASPVVFGFSYFTIARADGGAIDNKSVALNIYPGSPPFLPQQEDGNENSPLFDPSVCTVPIGHDVMVSDRVPQRCVGLEELDVLADATILPPHLEIIDTEHPNLNLPLDMKHLQTHGQFPVGIMVDVQLSAQNAVTSLSVRKVLASAGVGSLAGCSSMTSVLDELDSQYHREILQSYAAGEIPIAPSVWMSTEFSSCPACVQWVPPSMLASFITLESEAEETGSQRLSSDGVTLAFLVSQYMVNGLSVFNPKYCSADDIIGRLDELVGIVHRVSIRAFKSLVDVVEKRGFRHLLAHVAHSLSLKCSSEDFETSASAEPDTSDRKMRYLIAFIHSFASLLSNSEHDYGAVSDPVQLHMRELVSVLSQQEHDVALAISSSLIDLHCHTLTISNYELLASSTENCMRPEKVLRTLLGNPSKLYGTDTNQAQIVLKKQQLHPISISVSMAASQWFHTLTSAESSPEDTMWVLSAWSSLCTAASYQAYSTGCLCGYRVRSWCRHVASYAGALDVDGTLFDGLTEASHDIRKDFDLTGLEGLSLDSETKFTVDMRLLATIQQQIWEDIGLSFGHLQLLLLRCVVRILAISKNQKTIDSACKAVGKMIPFLSTLLPRQLSITVALVCLKCLEERPTALNILTGIATTSNLEEISVDEQDHNCTYGRNNGFRPQQLFESILHSSCNDYIEGNDLEEKSLTTSLRDKLLLQILKAEGRKFPCFVTESRAQSGSLGSGSNGETSRREYLQCIIGCLSEDTFSNNSISVELLYDQTGSRALSLLYDDNIENEEARQDDERNESSRWSRDACENSTLISNGLMHSWCMPLVLRRILRISRMCSLNPMQKLPCLYYLAKLLHPVSEKISVSDGKSDVYAILLMRVVPGLLTLLKELHTHHTCDAQKFSCDELAVSLSYSTKSILAAGSKALESSGYLLGRMFPHDICLDLISSLQQNVDTLAKVDDRLRKFDGRSQESFFALYRMHTGSNCLHRSCKFVSSVDENGLPLRLTLINFDMAMEEVSPGSNPLPATFCLHTVISDCVDWLRDTIGDAGSDIPDLHKLLKELVDSFGNPGSEQTQNSLEKLISSSIVSSMWMAVTTPIGRCIERYDRETIAALTFGKKSFDFALHCVLVSLRNAYLKGSSSTRTELLWRSTLCTAARLCMTVIHCGARNLEQAHDKKDSYSVCLPLQEYTDHDFEALPETWWINSPLHAILQLMRLEESFELRMGGYHEGTRPSTPKKFQPAIRQLKCPDVTRTVIATCLDWVVASLAPMKPGNTCLYLLRHWGNWWNQLAQKHNPEQETPVTRFTDFTILPLEEILALSDVDELECPIVPFCHVRDVLVTPWPWATANSVLSLLHRLLSGSASVGSDLLVNDLVSKEGLGWIFKQLSDCSMSLRAGLRIIPLPPDSSTDIHRHAGMDSSGASSHLQSILEAARSLEEMAKMVNGHCSMCLLELIQKLQGGNGVVDKDSVLAQFFGDHTESAARNRSVEDDTVLSETSRSTEDEDDRISVIWSGGLDDSVAISSVIAEKVYHMISLNRQRTQSFLTGILLPSYVTTRVAFEMFGSTWHQRSFYLNSDSLISPEAGCFYVPLQRLLWKALANKEGQDILKFAESLDPSRNNKYNCLSWDSPVNMLYLIQFLEGLFNEALTSCERSAEWHVALDLCDSLKRYYEWEGRQLMGKGREERRSFEKSHKNAAELLKMKLQDLSELRERLVKASQGVSCTVYVLPNSSTTISRETAKELEENPQLSPDWHVEDASSCIPKAVNFTPPLRLSPVYYSVYFQGEGFGETERNRWFIYRLWETHTRETLISQLQDEYPFATVVPGNYPTTFLSLSAQVVKCGADEENLGSDSVPVEVENNDDQEEILYFAGAGDGLSAVLDKVQKQNQSISFYRWKNNCGTKRSCSKVNICYKAATNEPKSLGSISEGPIARIYVFPASLKAENHLSEESKSNIERSSLFQSFVAREKTVKLSTSGGKEKEACIDSSEHSVLNNGPVLVIGKFKQSRENNVDRRIVETQDAPLVRVSCRIEGGAALWHECLSTALSGAGHRLLIARREGVVSPQSIFIQWTGIPDTGRQTPWITRRVRACSVRYESAPIVFGCLNQIQALTDVLVNRLRWVYGTTIVSETLSEEHDQHDNGHISDAYEEHLGSLKSSFGHEKATQEDDTNYGVFGINFGAPQGTSRLGIYEFENEEERNRWFASRKNLTNIVPLILGWRPGQVSKGCIHNPLDLFGGYTAKKAIPKDYAGIVPTANLHAPSANIEKTRRTTLLWPPRKQATTDKTDGNNLQVDVPIRVRAETSRSLFSDSLSAVSGSPRHYGIFDPSASTREVQAILRSGRANARSSASAGETDEEASAFGGDRSATQSAMTDFLRSRGVISKRKVKDPASTPGASGLGYRFFPNELHDTFDKEERNPYEFMKGKAVHSTSASRNRRKHDEIPLPNLIPSGRHVEVEQKEGSNRMGTVEVDLENETGEIVSASAAACVLASAIIDGLSVASPAANDPQVSRQLIFDYSLLKDNYIAAERTQLKREYHRKQKELRESGRQEEEQPNFDSMVPQEWHWAAVKLDRNLKLLYYLVEKAKRLHENLAEMENEASPLQQAHGKDDDEQRAVMSIMRGQSTFRSLGEHGTQSTEHWPINHSVGALNKAQRKIIFDICVARLLHTNTL